MRHSKLVFTLAICGTSLGVFGQSAEELPLSTAEISALLKDGGLVKGTNSRGQSYELRLKANGTMQATSTRTNGPGHITDSGRWQVKEAALCVTYTEWQGGETRCASVRRNGELFKYGEGAELAPEKS